MRYVQEIVLQETASGDLSSPVIPGEYLRQASIHAWPTGNVTMTVQLQASNEPGYLGDNQDFEPANWVDIPSANTTVAVSTPGLIAATNVSYAFLRVLCTGGFQESGTITTVADSSGSLNNKYFSVYDPVEDTTFVFWLDINSAGTDPEVPGTVSVQVSAATNASANTIASAIVTAAFAVTTSLNFSSSTNTVTIQESVADSGLTTSDGPVGFTTGFTFGAINSTGTISIGFKGNGF